MSAVWLARRARAGLPSVQRITPVTFHSARSLSRLFPSMPRPASRLSLSSVALPLPSPLWRSFASASSPLLSPPSASTEGNVRSPPSPNASAASNASSTTFSASTLGNAAGVSASSAVSLGSGWLERLQSAGQIELYHMSHVALLAGVPLALLLSPSLLVVPVDLALGLLIPWHMHVGMVNVLEDYVPRPYRKAAVLLMTAVSIATALGVLKLNLCGAGLTESVKALWRQPIQPPLPPSSAPAPRTVTTTTVRQA